MPATIVVEKHAGQYGPWWTVELRAGDDVLVVGETHGEENAEDVARRWADHLGIEIERTDWADLTRGD